MDYLDFVPAITERGQIKTFIESDTGIEEQEGKLYSVFATWWQLHAPGLSELPKTKKVMELRAEFLSLQDIEAERDAAAKRLSEFLKGLGYV